MIWKIASSGIVILLLAACQLQPVKCDQDCRENWLDGPLINDTADLVSARIAHPTALDLDKRVVIACHGFTATSYEWEEYGRFAEKDTSILVSRILLGGHGNDIEDFEKTSWHDWGAPILTEYGALVQKGYKHISLIGSSASGTLLLQDLHDHAFIPAPEHILLIDPFVVPVNKMLYFAKIIGPFIGNSPSTLDAGEKKHWYTNRPAAQLEQLLDLITSVKMELKTGFALPEGTACNLWNADGDRVADASGDAIIYSGLHLADGKSIAMETVRSPLHVFTRLQGRDKVTAADSALQLKTFRKIDSLIKQ